ncbi:MAG: response regulator, partial [Halobacteriaceae archaeon]
MQQSSDVISVLIVEDEPELADLYKEYLQDEFDVQTVLNGEKALEIVDESFDIILLDRKMPDMSGDEVLTKLRKRGYNMPIAMVTAVEPDTDIVDMPFDEYLIKPINRNLLVRTVRVLSNRASFEEKSREFFRLAAKKTSLNDEITANQSQENPYQVLIQRMSELQEELDDTVKTIVADDAEVVPRYSLKDSEITDLLSEISEHSLPDNIQELVQDYQELHDEIQDFIELDLK